jgi:hypothetical protein
MSAAPSSPTTSSSDPSLGSSFGQRVIEYFTLRNAEAALARLPELARGSIADTIELSRQQAAAAEALFAVGHTAEALRLGREALESTQRAADQYARAMGLDVSERANIATDAEALPAEVAAPTDEASSEADVAADAPFEGDAIETEAAKTDAPETDAKAPAPIVVAAKGSTTADTKAAWRQLAVRSGMSSSRIGGIERQLASSAALSVPRLEKDVAPAHVDGFREVLQARAAIEETLAPATHTKGSLLGARIWRGVSSTFLALAVIGVLVYMLKPVEGTFVRASATWADSPDFRADYIIDGDENTMWLLPENAGWVEVRTAPPIAAVHRITLVNAGNARVSDRGTRVYRLEIYAGGELAESIDGEFGDELSATTTHEVSVQNVERIRFVAVSGYRAGAGLTELRWE